MNKNELPCNLNGQKERKIFHAYGNTQAYSYGLTSLLKLHTQSIAWGKLSSSLA